MLAFYKTDNTQGIASRIPFLDPSFRERYADAIFKLENLEKDSSEIVMKEKNWDDIYYQESVRLNSVIFIISILFLVVGIYFFRLQVLVPIQKLIEILQAVRKGNLNQKFGKTRNDELGLMAGTVDSMIQELELARRERVEFIGSVAHDLKNPLTAIMMNCELVSQMEVRTKANTGIFQTIDRIKVQLERMERITEDILEAAKEGRPMWTLKRSVISLNALAQQMIDYFEAAHPDYAYSLESQSDGIEVYGDPDRLRKYLQAPVLVWLL